jgi:hypothetical protein
MVQVVYALKKVEFVFDVARKDPREFMVDLLRDPRQTLKESGIDLSPHETQAVIDVVEGTSESRYAPKLHQLRQRWKDILTDNNMHERRDADELLTAK